MKKFICVFLICIFAFTLTSCNKAENVQYNISKSSDSFETYRKVTVMNLRTDNILLEVEGYISIKDSAANELAIIIMTGPNEYMMHYVYYGSEVIYLVEQLENTDTNPYHWDIRIFAEYPKIVLE